MQDILKEKTVDALWLVIPLKFIVKLSPLHVVFFHKGFHVNLVFFLYFIFFITPLIITSGIKVEKSKPWGQDPPLPKQNPFFFATFFFTKVTPQAFGSDISPKPNSGHKNQQEMKLCGTSKLIS